MNIIYLFLLGIIQITECPFKNLKIKKLISYFRIAIIFFTAGFVLGSSGF